MDEPRSRKQPWEVDFPIEREEARHVSRREFAKFLGLVSGGLCLGSGWLAIKGRLWPSPEVRHRTLICNIADVPVGGMKMFTLKDTRLPYILIRLDEQEWRAYEQKCTHLSCSVFFRNGKIECPCHNGFFDARTGMVLQGPPPRPLPSLKVEVVDDQVWVLPPSTETVS